MIAYVGKDKPAFFDFGHSHLTTFLFGYSQHIDIYTSRFHSIIFIRRSFWAQAAVAISTTWISRRVEALFVVCLCCGFILCHSERESVFMRFKNR